MSFTGTGRHRPFRLANATSPGNGGSWESPSPPKSSCGDPSQLRVPKRVASPLLAPEVEKVDRLRRLMGPKAFVGCSMLLGWAVCSRSTSEFQARNKLNPHRHLQVEQCIRDKAGAHGTPLALLMQLLQFDW